MLSSRSLGRFVARPNPAIEVQSVSLARRHDSGLKVGGLAKAEPGPVNLFLEEKARKQEIKVTEADQLLFHDHSAIECREENDTHDDQRSELLLADLQEDPKKTFQVQAFKGRVQQKNKRGGLRMFLNK